MANLSYVCKCEQDDYFNYPIEKLTISDSIYNNGELNGQLVITNIMYESFLKEIDLEIGTPLYIITISDNYQFYNRVEITSYQHNGKFLTIFFRTPQPVCVLDKGFFNKDINTILSDCYPNVKITYNLSDVKFIPYIFISKDKLLKNTMNSLTQLSNRDLFYYINLDEEFRIESLNKIIKQDYKYTLEFNEQGVSKENKIRIISLNLFTNNLNNNPCYHFWSFDFDKYKEDKKEIDDYVYNRIDKATANYEVFNPLLNNENSYRQKHLSSYFIEKAIIEIIGWSNNLCAGNMINLIVYPKGYNNNYKPENNVKNGLYLIEKTTRILMDKQVMKTILVAARIKR